jgi:hypothetical protein
MMKGAFNFGRSMLRIIAFDARDEALLSAKLLEKFLCQESYNAALNMQ